MVQAREDGPLVTRARDGDEEAWRELYLLHGRRLVAWLSTAPTGDVVADADDVAAEAWLVAATRMGEFSGSDEDFGGWLVGISRHVVSNHRRRAMRRRTDPSDQIGQGVGDLHVEPEDPDSVALDLTRRMLALLSPREAEVIACIDVSGLDVSATARALDMSPTAVRVARHRALGRLRRLIGDGTIDVHGQG
ncbi:MAG TPA: sigma-70 family RNA polymerase sigma factor [Nocardioides sp.]|nr:sigma-70 family RNA polymerase sigma factor [Nocardioides sp.]